MESFCYADLATFVVHAVSIRMRICSMKKVSLCAYLKTFQNINDIHKLLDPSSTT